MSKTQRLKSKKISNISEKQQSTDTMNSVPSRQRSLIFPKTNGQNSSQSQIHITKQKQLQLEEYRDLKNSNPKGLNFSLDAFPYSPGLDAKCNLPLAFSFSPLLILENENVTTMNKYIDEIPRCECKAYMNYYNEIEKGKFKCFLCNSLSYLGQYDPNKQPNDERKSNLYQALGSPKFYESIAAQDYIVFLIDLSRQAFTSQMIHYAIAAIKQSLKNPQFDEYFVQIYGYDEQVYFFEFSDESQEPKCIIVDKTIQQDINFNSYKHQKMFKQYREIFFSLLDELPQICEDNDKNSNFSHCFDYIYKLTKGTGAKYYILQASQSLVTQPFVAEDFKAEKQISNPIPVKSVLESKNKKFFERYCTNFINNSTSISMFIFGKQYKNIKVFGDIFKLTNSELKYYSKDSVGELQKFYYQFSYLLTATYFKDVYVEFFISEAWRFTNVYGNCFRARNGSISFFANHIEPSKHFVILVNFSKSTVLIPTHCTVQLVINYRYKKEHFTTVVTSVQNLTGHIQKIYTGIDVYLCLAAIARAYIVNLRINGEEAQKKLEQITASIYESGLKIYKKNEDLPYEILSLLAGTLAMKKSRFSKPQQIINTQLFDKVLSQRNHLQFSTINQVATTFMPILFDLNNMEQNMCLIENNQNFIYPNTLEVKFNNVKQGIFLMDSGLLLFLFIAKLCDLRLLQNLIGMQKIPKNHTLTEEILNQQQNFEAEQVKNLIKTLRQQKSFAWVPLCIVHCGQNSRNEKEFYMQFYAEKYDQYQKYKYSFHEYLQILKKCERTS